jgi:hypothetical protein
MLAVIVAAEPLNAENSFTTTAKVEVPRPEMASWFYDVPAGTRALRVDIDSRRELAVAVVRPDTRTANAVRTAPGGGGGGFGGGGATRSRASWIVTDPMPGVWEVRLSDLDDVRTFDAMQAEKDEPVPPTEATLTVSAIAVDLSLPAVTDPAMMSSGALTHELTLSNRMGAFVGGVTALPLGAARRERPSIRHGEQLQYEIDVPAGAATLLVRAGDFADARADLDLYVVDCTGKQCRNPQTDSDPIGDEVVIVQNPAAGTWKVVVDAASVPTGSTSFAYLDAILSTAFGTAAAADVMKERKPGDQWSTHALTWGTGTLPAGREAFPAVLLQGQLSGGVTFGLGVIELLAPRTAATSSSHQR